MFSDEFSKKSIYISVTGFQGTLNIIEAAMKYYLNSTSNSLTGRMSLRELNKQNLQLKDIPLSSKDLKGMEKELKRYGVDYAIKQDLSQKDTYKVFFKAKDISSIELALKNYTSKEFSQNKKMNIKDIILKYKEKSKEINKDIKEKNLTRGDIEGR